ncbi:MAG: AzlC family ABC transporter permease, partial [Clostridia bacterium]|nr:AzlC family ABC transporter permease [Clostridia bacterium]
MIFPGCPPRPLHFRSIQVKKQNVLLRSFQTSLPVMAGYVVLGMGFGMVLRVKGFGLPWAFAMSLFIYAGSMQFVLANLLAGGASLLATAATTLLVNARHLFYGISMIDRYRESGKAKPYLIFALTDETYSLLSTDPRL